MIVYKQTSNLLVVQKPFKLTKRQNVNCSKLHLGAQASMYTKRDIQVVSFHYASNEAKAEIVKLYTQFLQCVVKKDDLPSDLHLYH